MQDFWHGAAAVLLYILPAAGIMFTARRLITIPDELFRKILHFILLGAYIPFLFAFRTWQHAAVMAAGMIVVFYPLLALAGRIPAFTAFVTERRAGEFKHSMVLALLVMLGAITIGWGLLKDRLLMLACIYAWGMGDAFAALVGKRFGRHKIRWRFADPRKSAEGSAAMLITSALAAFIVLMIRGGMPAGLCALVAVLAAAVCTAVELCTGNGLDTVTCPAAAMAVILPLIHLLGG